MFAARKAIRESDDKKAAERAGRHAAILIPLCMKEGKPAVLFTVRSHLVSTHKGQVSFPGGHTEPGESAPATAMREATEELGDGIGPIRLLARGTAIPALTGTLVHPVVGWVERDVGPAPHTHLHLCEAEVDRAFALTLDELLDPALQTAPDFASRVTPQRKEQDFSGPHPKRGKSGKWPVFLGEPNGAEVWGLTAFVLDSILRELIQPLRVQQRQE